MTPWILFSSVSVFHNLNRNSLGPSVSQLALTERRSIKYLLISWVSVRSTCQG